MNEKEYSAFMSKNSFKISNYINSIDIINRDIKKDDFNESMDTLESINPKIDEFGQTLVVIMFSGRLDGKHWSYGIKWNEFLLEYENEISEIVDYFKTAYPLYFLKLKHYQYRTN